eukprot:COSAG01_NODE_2453_length_7674_cov_13.713003_5_plen_108_part_00
MDSSVKKSRPHSCGLCLSNRLLSGRQPRSARALTYREKKLLLVLHEVQRMPLEAGLGRSVAPLLNFVTRTNRAITTYEEGGGGGSPRAPLSAAQTRGTGGRNNLRRD